MNRSIKSGLIITIASAIVFGLYPPATQVALRDGANSSFIIIVSTFFRALGLVLFCKWRGFRITPERHEISSFVRGGFFQAISIFGILGSLAYIPGPVTIVVMFTHTLMLLIFLAIIGEQKFNLLNIISTISALIGVSLVVDVWGVGSGTLEITGVMLAFLAAIATASRLYVFGKQVQNTNPALVGARIFSVTFLFTLLLAAFRFPVPPNSVEGQLWFLIASLSLILGTFGMFYGISLLGPFRFSLLIKLEPVFTALFSYLILGDKLLPMQYLGIALVILSLVFYQVSVEKKKSDLSRI